MATRTALVTGATGLVGSHIVERLVQDGWSVRALVRSSSSDTPPLGAEPIVGDVLDADGFARAATGCDVIFHTAATIVSGAGWESYRHLNVDGTQNAITAAERSGARLLQLSSVAVYGNEGRYRNGAKTDEDTPLGPLPERAFYPRSKRESETLVMEAHRAGRIWATAVRPDVIYGRRDRQFVPRIGRLLRFGFAPAIGGGHTTLALVHAANVADGAVRTVMHDGAGGRAYNLANDGDVTVREFFWLAGVGLEKRIRFLPIPLGVARGGFKAAMVAARVVTGGKVNVFASSSLSFVTRDNPFTSERARRELGWSPVVDPSEGIPDAFRWWKQHARSV